MLLVALSTNGCEPALAIEAAVCQTIEQLEVKAKELKMDFLEVQYFENEKFSRVVMALKKHLGGNLQLPPDFKANGMYVIITSDEVYLAFTFEKCIQIMGHEPIDHWEAIRDDAFGKGV